MKPETLQRIWFAGDPLARTARAALAPASLLFGGISLARNRMYDAGLLRSLPPAIPAVSVGNLTVGGTGKTPISAHICAMLGSAGAEPAVVLRGYGSDEPLVHKLLNPNAVVVTNSDRVAALAEAEDLGAEVAVLDDAFQHRRVARQADVVLLSADAPLHPRWLLPAGPWREPLSALARATMAIVTRKAADDEAVQRTIGMIRRSAPRLPIATAELALGGLRLLSSAVPTDVQGEQAATAGSVAGSAGAASTGARSARRARDDVASHAPASGLGGSRVLAVAALANPRAFIQQLTALGAIVTPLLYPDHHDFTEQDVTRITRLAADADVVVCSLKDAVKLAPMWPRGAPDVWYVTQTVTFERGGEHVQEIVDSLLSQRRADANP